MTKNLNYKNGNLSNRKISASHESSPLHYPKPKKETSSVFQPPKLNAPLNLSSKDILKKNPNLIAANMFIGNLSMHISNSQTNYKKSPSPFAASISSRRNSKQNQDAKLKEDGVSAMRESKSRQKEKSLQTSFDAALNSLPVNGTAYEPRKNPLALVTRHYSEASNDLTKSTYIPKFKPSDPQNKFSLGFPPKVLTHAEPASKMKKPNGRNQRSFDANGLPLGKLPAYFNASFKPSTAQNSPRNKDSEAKKAQNGSISYRESSQSTVAKQLIKAPSEKILAPYKIPGKSPVIISKHRKTPSFELAKRSEHTQQKSITPPILGRMRKSADSGEQWQGGLETFNNHNNKGPYRFAIRTRAGVAPNGTRKINQDSFVFHTNYGKKNDRCLLGVCDGHGMNGHFVSGFVKETLPLYLLSDPNMESNIGLAFTNAFELCLQKLLVCDFDCKFSGTTAVFVLMDGGKIITANAGDSRAIIGTFDQSSGWDCKPLTVDHKPDTPLEAQRIAKAGGRIEPFRDMDGNFVGPSRVWLLNQDIPGLAMSRSIGDLVAASVGVSYIPEIKEFKINPTDKFMIVASDGVWEFIESIDVVKTIAPFYEQNDIEGACDYLLGLALKRWQEEEEVVVDDITLIMTFF